MEIRAHLAEANVVRGQLLSPSGEVKSVDSNRLRILALKKSFIPFKNCFSSGKIVGGSKRCIGVGKSKGIAIEH